MNQLHAGYQAMWNAAQPSAGPVLMPESPTERAAHAIHCAVADFISAIIEAGTPAEAWRLHALLVPLTSVLESTERKARLKAEALGQ